MNKMHLGMDDDAFEQFNNLLDRLEGAGERLSDAIASYNEAIVEWEEFARDVVAEATAYAEAAGVESALGAKASAFVRDWDAADFGGEVDIDVADVDNARNLPRKIG